MLDQVYRGEDNDETKGTVCKVWLYSQRGVIHFYKQSTIQRRSNLGTKSDSFLNLHYVMQT